MAHNAYHFQLSRLEKLYSNFKVDIFGSSTSYARMRKEDIPKNCDFILLDSSNFYKDDELHETKNIGQKIAEENNKRVTIGYVYYIPIEEREIKNTYKEFVITSFKDGDVHEQIIPINLPDDLLSLSNIIVKVHNELENQKVLKNNK